MPDLRVTGLVKTYGAVSALNGMSFEVAAGEFFVLLGPSAAGKTTTLRSIAGLEKLQAGRIVFDGRDVTTAPVQGRNMAMIFQTFALYPHLTVYDNLAYPLREARRDRGEIDRRVRETADMLRITHTLPRKPGTLSGGEQQRLAIGRALIRRPAMLLLDEPLTNLDAKLRHDTRAEFKRLHRDLGMTMVYATPDQLEALSMGQRIAVMRHGRIEQVDTPDALYAAPANDYVATLVGAPPMNLVPGTLHRNGGGAGTGAGPTIELPFLGVDAGPWANRLADAAPGTSVLFGVRPHDLAPVREGRGAADRRGPAFPATVHLIEPLGGVTVLDLATEGAGGGTLLKMVLPEEEALAYPVGRRIEVEISLPDTHLFYRDSGVAIW